MSRSGVALRLYYAASFAAMGAYLPFLPPWLEALGISGLAMSVIMALRPMLGMVGPIGFGLVADALGLRGSLLRMACFGALVAFGVIAALSGAGRSPSFGMLLVLVGMFAFFRAPMMMMADVTALEGTESYGRVRLWGSLGFLLMALAAGRWVSITGGAALPLVIAAALFVALLASFFVPSRIERPPKPVLRDARQLFVSADFRLFLLGIFLWQSAQVAYDLCISLHLRDLGASGTFIGSSWALGTLAEVALMAGSPFLLQRFGAGRLLTCGFIVAAVRWLLIATVTSLPVILALQPLHAFTFGLVWVAALAFIKERAPSHVLATAQGLFAAAMSFGSVMGLLTWGPLYDRWGGAAVFLTASGIAAVAGIVGVLLQSAVRLNSPSVSSVPPR